MIPILHQEADFLIVDKPSGLMTHPNKEGEDAVSVQLVAQFPELKGVGGNPLRPGIVHRLDKETSGLLIITRTQAMYDHLRKQFDEGKVQKEYTALVYGAVLHEHGIINTPLSRSKKGQFTTGEGGRDAVTEYNVIKSYKLSSRSRETRQATSYTLLALHPKTGRTHQLRVHLKSIGHPIVGDPLYRAKIKQRIDFLRLRSILRSRATAEDGQGFGGQARLFLHAARIRFQDIVGQWHEFSSPLPEELQQFLETLES